MTINLGYEAKPFVMPSKKMLKLGAGLSFLVCFVPLDVHFTLLTLYSPVATVGTTSSGAVDNMSEIKEVGTSV
jgi:hypothetical protein